MDDRVLVADDEAVLRGNIARFLASEGIPTDTAEDGDDALLQLQRRDYAVLITDLRMPGMSGIELLRRTVQDHPETLVLVITAHGTLETAIEALRLGAQDYVIKPLSLDALSHKVRRLLERRALEHRVRRLREEVQGSFEPHHIVAQSAKMTDVLALVHKAASARSNVLIEGESGTGKELIARALHEHAPWCDKDFVAVNLSAQPADLVDATLFGHEKGAYTGATSSRQGVFRAAAGGTVFLDEVGELPMAVQAKLLRVLETREVMPLGSDRPVPVDFRLVAATNKPLAALVQQGSFREDLYYRLHVVRIEMPPLRDRPDDIPALATRLVKLHARAMGKPTPRINRDTMQQLMQHPWRGNVREMSNMLERAVLLADDVWITPDLLPVQRGTDSEVHTPVLKDAMAHFERHHIERVLAQHDGDKVAAAKALDVHLATLYRHMERLGLG